ncbi:competence protein CoiA family protein [Endozoicomonas sp. YOMI1]|uniref:competence protein CoiA family protein n=1 Tax=Endozoicomonas sp. YOMI1 TaxID=2828739 RepID=UPI002147C618|nr:competence protein CoiA family protein [Endozoicomonas sp. YOMI1]
MNQLKVPLGLTIGGELVSPEEASKNEEYFCPSCEGNLILKKGEFRTKHFSHPSNSACNQESILHKTAKSLIIKSIVDNYKNGRKITIQNECSNCKCDYEINLEPKTFSGAQEERRVGEFVCDVVGYRNKIESLAIEVLVTHAVDDYKAKNLPIYWLEVNAEDIIQNPYKWLPTKKGLKGKYCGKCKSNISDIISVADRWNIDRSLYSLKGFSEKANYVAGIETCFKCKERIPVFWWQGVPFCEDEPPLPRPVTIMHKYSKQFGGAYWANTCINCGMLQGDNHLYLFPKAPFKDLPLSQKFMPKRSTKNHNESPVMQEMMKVIRRNFG